MRTVLHLSDVHFGRTDPALVTALIEFAGQLEPDLVAVSGDLTQRARTTEFRAARRFLEALPNPQIVVPGNHDVPLDNLYGRFVQRFSKFQTYITEDLAPVFLDDEIAVAGINTARSWTWKGGRINADQIARVRDLFCPFDSKVRKIVVGHHPFDVPSEWSERTLVGRARLALDSWRPCGIDVFLSGHHHLSYSGDVAAERRIGGHSALIIHAGTATSTRGRGEANAFNVLRFQGDEIGLERFVWSDTAFQTAAPLRFRLSTDGWRRMKEH